MNGIERTIVRILIARHLGFNDYIEAVGSEPRRSCH
jgi:hypothetical protein